MFNCSEAEFSIWFKSARWNQSEHNIKSRKQAKMTSKMKLNNV